MAKRKVSLADRWLKTLPRDERIKWEREVSLADFAGTMCGATILGACQKLVDAVEKATALKPFERFALLEAQKAIAGVLRDETPQK